MITTRRRSAFTFPEFGALLVATGVVATVAYSAYRTYAVRKQVTQGLALANELIPGVTEFFHRHGEVPATLGPPVAHSKQAGQIVESVTIVDGRIDVLFGRRADPSIAGDRISLTPYETVERNVVWLCGNERPNPGLKPLGFAGGGRQATQVSTTIEARYLSGPCR